MTQPEANVPVAKVPEKTLSAHALSRRTVFAGAGAAGALAVVATALPLREQAATAPAVEKAAEAEGGYRLTEHVQRYYQTARV